MLLLARKLVSQLNAGRLESFFGAVTTKHSTTGKRKEPDSKSKATAKKGKMGGVGKKK